MSRNSKCHCHECDLAISLPSLKTNEKALCPRCGFLLTAIHKNAVERIIALSITAIIFLIATLPFDFLAFKANGLENKFTLLQSFSFLFTKGHSSLVIIEIITIFAIPLFILSSLIYLLVCLKRQKLPFYARRIMNIMFSLLPWAMVEIFVVGVLVSLIKIMSMADVSVGASFIALILFALFMTIVILHIDKHQFYQLLEDVESRLNKKIKNKTSSKHTLSHDLANNKPDKELVNTRKSIQQTWALIITAVILYIPANLLPIMTTTVLGQDEPSTIFGGVVLLWHLGSYPIAIVIFIASVAVPLAKFIVLAWLNYSVQKSHNHLTAERIKFYRMAEFIGRWSMVDVFVVIILASLIQLGNTMSIYPGSATLAFSGSVVVTMFAAMTFEPKLIWQASPNHEK